MYVFTGAVVSLNSHSPFMAFKYTPPCYRASYGSIWQSCIKYSTDNYQYHYQYNGDDDDDDEIAYFTVPWKTRASFIYCKFSASEEI